jgi:hypothetical protein
MASVWKRSNQNTRPRVLGIILAGSVITTKETNRKRAQRLAEEYENASRTKRTFKQGISASKLKQSARTSDGFVRDRNELLYPHVYSAPDGRPVDLSGTCKD